MNVRKTVVLLGFLFLQQLISGQVTDSIFQIESIPKRADKIVRLSFLIPGISVETNIKQDYSLFTEIGTGYYLNVNNNFTLNLLYNSGDYNYNKDVYQKFYPYVKVEGRYFYNFTRRGKNNRSTANNSGEYLSIYNLLILNEAFVSGFTWGFQRNVHKFYFNFNCGPTFVYTNERLHAIIMTDIKLGVKLFSVPRQ